MRVTVLPPSETADDHSVAWKLVGYDSTSRFLDIQSDLDVGCLRATRVSLEESSTAVTVHVGYPKGALTTSCIERAVLVVPLPTALGDRVLVHAPIK